MSRARYAAWRARLDAIAAAGRTRKLRTMLPTGPVTGILDGQEVIVASSNDYLGLAWVIRTKGRGAGASRLITGTRPVHEQLEAALEAWLGRPALFFGSGYQANLAVFSTVCIAGQVVASDALNHASIIDGLRLGRAERVVLPHGEPSAIPERADLVVIEGLYSMDGDVPDIAAYVGDHWLAVDEAHALGALGPEGRGAAASVGVEPDILIGTFGKAFGASGAFVAGPPELKELLVNAGRSFIYTTAPPESVAVAALEGLRRVERADALREKLAENAARLRQYLVQLGWTVRGDHHVLGVICGDDATQVSERLLRRGVFAPAIRYPTVPAGTERIRIAVSAAHGRHHIEAIANAFGAR